MLLIIMSNIILVYLKDIKRRTIIAVYPVNIDRGKGVL